MLHLYSTAAELLTPAEIRAQLDKKRADLEALQIEIKDAQDNAQDALRDSDRSFANYWRKQVQTLQENAAKLQNEIQELAKQLPRKKGH